MTNRIGRTPRWCGAVALLAAVALAGAAAPAAQAAAAAPTFATVTTVTTDKPSTPSNPSSPGKPKSSGGAVHPGAFCGKKGATGTSSSGNRYSCQPDKNGRLRWLRK